MSPKIVENISNFEGWGLTLVAYKESVVSYRFNFYVVHAFLYKQHFYKQRQAEIGKKFSNAKQTSEVEFLLLFSFFIRYHPKIIEHILKNKKTKCLYSWGYNRSENDDENEKQIT